MERQNTTFLKMLKNIKSSDYIYLSVLVVFLLIVIIIFSYSTKFIVININKIFSTENSTKTQSLNMENYLIIEKKLNLPINVINEEIDLGIQNTTENEAPIEEPINSINIENNNENIISIQKEELNKQSVTLSVLNSTNKKGVALKLAEALQADGFSMAYTSNEKKSYEITTILIKDSKKEYASFVEEAVKKSYKNAVTEIFQDDPTKIEFDVTIIIGKI